MPIFQFALSVHGTRRRNAIRPRSTPHEASTSGRSPITSSNGGASGDGCTKTNGPSSATDARSRPSSPTGSPSPRGIFRSPPSRSYVHAW